MRSTFILRQLAASGVGHGDALRSSQFSRVPALLDRSVQPRNENSIQWYDGITRDRHEPRQDDGDDSMSFALVILNTRLQQSELRRVRQQLAVHTQHFPPVLAPFDKSRNVDAKFCMQPVEQHLLANRVEEPNVLRSMVLGAGIGGAFSFAKAIGVRPALIPSQIAYRVTFGVIVAGATTGIFQTFFNKWRRVSFNRPELSARQEDKQFLPAENCAVLGIDPGKPASLADVKAAYRHHLLLWRSADNRQDSHAAQRAGVMRQQVENAYRDVIGNFKA